MFIPKMTVRRTISLPKAIDDLVRRHAEHDGSYSAAVARLVEAGARRKGDVRSPRYVATGSGPPDLARAAERYLRQAARHS